MERKRQREIALVVIAALAIALITYTVRARSPEATASSQPARPSSAASLPAKPSSPPKGLTELDLSALNAPKAQPQEIVRNPFRFKPKPPPPPPPAAIMPATPVVTGPPPPPRIPLKFIGVMESQKAGRVAILRDNNGVYHGREGETIEGRYRIIRIGVESIELAYVDGRGRQTIRQTGQ
jgi:hypothetical protein